MKIKGGDGTSTGTRSRRLGWNLKTLVLLGIVFHVVYLFSIIDIYFRSPIVHGMTPHASSTKPPAQRVLVFVADGLRADKLFETLALVQRRDGSGKYFLRDIVQQHGRWGVSHARVPTESRPGHVALFAGFYEDVSAVTKGWKANPVEFDSVFNESARSWSWGSPDILPMFAHNVPQMYAHSYHEDSEDFASQASNLDTWVFDRVEELFASSRKNHTLASQLHEPQSVFFLHLLGIDTNGHAHRPYSTEYLENIDIVDQGVERLYHLFEDYYGDGQTTYIFTSDHGMHNKGSHGDGHPDNTETPFIVWGAGARKPVSPPAPSEKPLPAPAAWNLSGRPRFDINQADVAPLIAFFAGLPYPMNSVGVLPTAYIDASPSSVSEALLLNALEIHEQFQRKAQMKREHSLLFQPFAPLNDAQLAIRSIRAHMALGQHEQAQKEASRLLALSLEGLHYFQTYDWPFLLSVVSLGYVGWILFLVLHVVAHHTNLPAYVRHRLTRSTHSTNVLAIVAGIALFVFLWLEASPIQYYLYTLFPVVFWAQIWKARPIVAHYLPALLGSIPTFFRSMLLVLVFIGVLEAVVASFYYRELLCPVLLVVGCWPLLRERGVSSGLGLGWALCCFVLSIFPLLSVEFGSSIALVRVGGLVAFALGALPFAAKLLVPSRPPPAVVAAAEGKEKAVESERTKVTYLPPFGRAEARMAGLQLAAVLVAVWVVSSTNAHLADKLPVPFINHLLAWLALGSLAVLPFLFSAHPGVFLFNLFLALAVPFIFLSISYEVLFYCALSATLYLWYYLEAALFRGRRLEQLSSQPTRALTLSDARIALFFLYLCFVAFFGTGNIASISSFEVSSTFRFMSVFNPWAMGGLLVMKLILPFVLVSCAYHIIVASSQLDLSASFLLVIAFSDVLSLNFLFLVRDTGSWKDIGTSISHFAISNCFILFHLGIVALSSLLTARLRLPRASKPDHLSL